MTNLNLLFHKIYYEEIGTNDFKEAVNRSNRQIFEAAFVNADDFLACEIPNVKTVRMKTKYPGMLIGTGYPHGSGRADDDIKCGFSFDYVSGQPYIPGSSVKGVLRSHFKDHPEAVAEIAGILLETVKDLEAAIFDYGDTFLDAVLYDGAKGNFILGKDYLTPHSDATKNPIPIHIMKILPDVRFEFRFLVSDFTKDEFTFTSEQKKELFQTLLTLFGIGAKTNVGYGMLEADDSAPRAREARPTEAQRTQQDHGNNGGNRGCNNGGGRSNGGNHASTAPSAKVKCPRCGFMNFEYNLNGRKNIFCKKCNAKFS